MPLRCILVGGVWNGTFCFDVVHLFLDGSLLTECILGSVLSPLGTAVWIATPGLGASPPG